MSEIKQSNDPKYPLFAFMHDEYGLTLLDSELQAIIDACGKCTPTPSAAYVQQNSVIWTDEDMLNAFEYGRISGDQSGKKWLKQFKKEHKLSNKTI